MNGATFAKRNFLYSPIRVQDALSAKRRSSCARDTVICISPTGDRGGMRTYSTGYGMNRCFDATGTYEGNRAVKVAGTVLMVKRRSEITVPAPAYRLVFLDEGRISPNSYAIQQLCRFASHQGCYNCSGAAEERSSHHLED